MLPSRAPDGPKLSTRPDDYYGMPRTHAGPADSRRRRDAAIVLSIVGVQAVLLLFAWFVTFNHVHGRVTASVEDLIQGLNTQTAEAINVAIGTIDGDLVMGSPEWERAQNVIESVELPGAGFACLLNSDGHIVCHPEMRNNPGLARVNLTEHLNQTDPEGRAALQPREGTPAEVGWIDFGVDGRHQVAVQPFNETGSRILVHQPVGGISAASALLTQGVVAEALLLGLLAILPTAWLSWLFIRRHDRWQRRWNRTLEKEIAERLVQLTRSRDALVMGLAKLADFRDNETGDHLERIRVYVTLLAEALRGDLTMIDDVWIHHLQLASSMHDIGKVGVPDAVLLKPGKLDAEEYEVIKQHSTIGTDTLLAIRGQFDEDPLINMSIEVALCHHERWDGKGYPYGISAEAIPLSARIVSVADVYDALTSPRVYKPALSHERAMAIIIEGRGTQFDPKIVEAFTKVADRMRAYAVEHHGDGPGIAA